MLLVSTVVNAAFWLPVARSTRPSRLKSAAATARLPLFEAKCLAASKVPGADFFPRRTLTVLDA